MLPEKTTAVTGLAKAVVLGAMSVAAMMVPAGPASAQFFGGWGGWFGGPPAIERDSVIPPRIIASILRGQGFRITDYPVRRGNRIIALGVDGRGQLMRFVLDAHDGAVIRTALVGAPRPPGYIGREDNTLAYGVPGSFGEPEQPGGATELPTPQKIKPKPKAKVKTAAKPPATLPQAAPASPATPPSQATQTPSPVTPAPIAPNVMPAVAPPVAVAPAEQPAPVVATPASPDVRPAPDAQPNGDIGPKVVPVKPVEARAPTAPVDVMPAAPVVEPAPISPAANDAPGPSSASPAEKSAE